MIVAAASNVQFVAKELTRAFQDESGITCEIVLNSSGKLAAQIKNGAPYDVLLSADQTYPAFLEKEGLTLQEPEQYASGQLIAWSTNFELSAEDLDFTSTRIEKIAIANPQVAPYGLAAMEALEKMSLGKEVSTKLVYGESISQVNQFVSLGAADVGITGQAIAFSSQDIPEDHWCFIPDSLYSPILQDIAILKTGNAPTQSKKAFLDFVLGPEGRQLLTKYGYR